MEKNISSNMNPIRITDSLSDAYQDNTPTGNAIEELPGVVEQDPVSPVILKEVDFGLSIQYFTADSIKISMQKRFLL